MISTIGKVLRFEIYKVIKNKFLCITFSVFFGLFLLFIILPVCYSKLEAAANWSSTGDRAAIMEGYEQDRDRYKLFFDFVNGEDVTLPEGTTLPGSGSAEYQAAFYKKEYLFYDYLIRTNTIESDYFNKGSAQEHPGSIIMNESAYIFGIFLPLFSLLSAVFVLGGEYGGGTAKNLLAAPVKRRSVFFGKVVFLCAVNALMFLLASLIPFAAGLSDLSARVLVYGTNGYFAQSVFTYLFLPRAFAMLVSMLFYTTLAALLSQAIKRRSWGLILSVLAYGGIQLLFGILEWSIGAELFMMPLSFLRYNFWDVYAPLAKFTTGWLWLIVAAAVVGAFAVLCTVLGARKTERQEY